MPENDNLKEIIDNIKDAVNYKSTKEELDNAENIKEVNKDGGDIVPPIYSYVPKMTAVFSDSTTLDLIDFVTILQFEMNLENYIFPLFSLQLLIPPIYIPKFQFDDDVEIKLEMLYKSSVEDNPALYEKLFETILVKTKQISSPVNIEGVIYKEQVQYLNKFIMEMKLVPKECLDANKFLFSGVYENCNIMQTLALMTTNIPNKVFIQQTDNIKTYDQLIFIPNNVFYSIQYLENYYGLYDRGLKMFYGFNMFRIQSKNFYDETGTNKIKVAFSRDSESPDEYAFIENGFKKLGDDNLITVTPNKVKIYDKRLYNKEILGTNVSMFNRDDNLYFEQVRNHDNTGTLNLEKTKSYINKYNNVQKEKEFLSRSMFTKQIEINLNNIIIDVPSCFKLFKINFDSTFYETLNSDYVCSGYYWRLINVNNNNGSSYFTCNSVLELQEV